MKACLENVNVAFAWPAPIEIGKDIEVVLFESVPVKVFVWAFVTSAVCGLVADALPTAFVAVALARIVEPTSGDEIV